MTRDEKGRFVEEHYCKWHSEDDDCDACGKCIDCGMCECGDNSESSLEDQYEDEQEYEFGRNGYA